MTRSAGRDRAHRAILRTKVIDDAVTDAAAWAQQGVLLGAGYDARAHRLPALAQLHVCEVNHPATQALEQAGLPLPVMSIAL